MPGGQQRFNEELDNQAGKYFKEMAGHIKTRIEAIRLNTDQLARFKNIDLNSPEMGNLLKAILTSDTDFRDHIGESYTYVNPANTSELCKFEQSITLPDGRKINIFISYDQLKKHTKDFWQLYYSESAAEA